MLPFLITVAALAALVPGMFFAAKPSEAMPPFAQAYGLPCSACHTVAPLLNANGRYIQRTGYASLDRQVLKRALPMWIGESLNYDSTAGASTGTPRYSFGNLAIHGVGYLAPDVTFHAQQWIVASDESGFVDTLWITYNNLLHRDGHLFIGKILNPAPSPYSQNSDLDTPTASSTLVGEHDWSATYNNRWGARFAYVHNALDAEAGYYLSSFDLNGATYFGAGDKTFQWKLAYATKTRPYEFGVFGSNGSIPVSTNAGLDRYNSVAGYVQLDPGIHGRPGLLGIYQGEYDGNPGIGPGGFALGPTTSRGASIEVLESCCAAAPCSASVTTSTTAARAVPLPTATRSTPRSTCRTSSICTVIWRRTSVERRLYPELREARHGRECCGLPCRSAAYRNNLAQMHHACGEVLQRMPSAMTS